jgi:hypothetical protein
VSHQPAAFDKVACQTAKYGLRLQFSCPESSRPGLDAAAGASAAEKAPRASGRTSTDFGISNSSNGTGSFFVGFSVVQR